MPTVRTLLATASALLLAGCGSLGPYSQVGQKLDVNVRLDATETWIAAAAAPDDPYPGRNEIRILVLGKDAGGIPTFSFSTLYVPIGSGLSATMRQGTWAEANGKLTLIEQTRYEMKNERAKSLGNRTGSVRYDDLNALHRLDAARSADRLVLGADSDFAGTYVPIGTAIGSLGPVLANLPACAFYVTNLAVMTTQVRVIGFGSAAMLQYRAPQSFTGTVSGAVNVAMSGGLTTPDVDILYTDQSDFDGVQLGGGLRTHSDAGGNGTTTRTVLFTFRPDATTTPITGHVDYDLTITNGFASSGTYTITIDGGATGTTTPQDATSPPVASCLGLP